MFIKTTFNSDLNHILNCVNKCDFGTKCFAKVEHFVLRLINEEERINALHLLIEKYSPNDKVIGNQYAQKSFHRTEIIRLDIEEASGKCKHIPMK